MSYSEQQERYLAMIDVLKEIKEANGFNTTVKKVLRGARCLSDFSGVLPGLSIYRSVNENASSQYSGEEIRSSMNIWGFCNVNAREDDYTNLDKLYEDVEKVLKSEDYNPYLNETFIKETRFYEGGIQDSFGFFNMSFYLLFDIA